MADLKAIFSDPRYKGLPEVEKAKVAEHYLGKDERFKGLPESEQIKVLNHYVGTQPIQTSYNSKEEFLNEGIPHPKTDDFDKSKESTLGQKIVGAGEAALATGTGLLAGTAGMLYGGPAIGANPEQMPKEAQETIKKANERFETVSGLAYQPRTETGQKYTENIGEALQKSGLATLPMMPELNALNATKMPLIKGGVIKNPRARELRALEKEHGVDLTYGQESGKVGAQRLEVGLKHIPFFGTGSKFEHQQEQVLSAAKNFISKFQKGEDYGEDIHASLNRGLTSAKNDAKVLYDDVQNQITKEGVTDNVEPTNFKNKSSELLNEYPDIFNRLPDESLQKTISSLQSGVESKEPESTIVSIRGSRIKLTPEQAKRMGIETKSQTGLTFKEARFLRDKLGDYINRAKNSAGVVGNKEFHQLNELKSALDNDIEVFGKTIGNEKVIEAFKKANQFYTENVVPFKDKLINKATSRDVDTDTILKSFVKEDRPKLAKKLYDRLDEHGKLAIRYGILKEAFDRSFDEWNGNFQSGKFSNSLHKLADANEIVFSAEEKNQVDGLSKLMKAAEQSGNNQKITSRVESLTKAEPIGMAAALAAAPIPTLKFGIGAKSMAWLLTSERGKNLLTEVSKTPEKSARYKELIRQAQLLATMEALSNKQNNYGN